MRKLPAHRVQGEDGVEKKVELWSVCRDNTALHLCVITQVVVQIPRPEQDSAPSEDLRTLATQAQQAVYFLMYFSQLKHAHTTHHKDHHH